nr:recombinase family protein [Candidatus Microthrix parvicella]
MKAASEIRWAPARSVHNSCAESTSHYSLTRPGIDTVARWAPVTFLGYARVSTAGQDASGQIDALNAAGCARIFVEHASGAKTERVELAKLLDQALPGDVVCVVRLDRLGRSLPHLIETVASLDTRGIGFRSLSENIDTTTAGGRLIFHVFGAPAEFERELIRERTNAGLTAARA